MKDLRIQIDNYKLSLSVRAKTAESVRAVVLREVALELEDILSRTLVGHTR